MPCVSFGKCGESRGGSKTSLASQTISQPTVIWVDGGEGSGTTSTLVLSSRPELHMTNRNRSLHRVSNSHALVT